MRRHVLTTLSAAAMLAIAAHSPASAGQLVTNGGFETGDLTGWSTSNLGSNTCPGGPGDWNVSNSGSATGCIPVSDPSGSNYAAYVMNDGPGPLTYRLGQVIHVPAGTTAGTLSFDWTSINDSDAGRTLSVSIGGTTVFSSSTAGEFDWTGVTEDVSAVLAADAGTSQVLEIDNYIPNYFSGPAGLGLDNVSLVTPTGVPEPASLALLGMGFAGLGLRRRRRS